jgi:hypothetical protein
MIDLFDLKMRKQGLAKRRNRMLEARRRDLGAGASLVLQHGDPRIKSGSSLPQVTIYRLTVHEADVVTLALLKDLDEQITAMSNEIERAALSAMQTAHEPRSSKLIPTAGRVVRANTKWTNVRSLAPPSQCSSIN